MSLFFIHCVHSPKSYSYLKILYFHSIFQHFSLPTPLNFSFFNKYSLHVLQTYLFNSTNTFIPAHICSRIDPNYFLINFSVIISFIIDINFNFLYYYHIIFLSIHQLKFHKLNLSLLFYFHLLYKHQDEIILLTYKKLF